MADHRRDPSANALAHGPAKTEDIESTRRALDRAERRTAGELRAAADRAQRDVARRERRARRSKGQGER